MREQGLSLRGLEGSCGVWGRERERGCGGGFGGGGGKERDVSRDHGDGGAKADVQFAPHNPAGAPQRAAVSDERFRVRPMLQDRGGADVPLQDVQI